MKKLLIVASGILLASSGSMYGWADKIINMAGKDITVARTVGINSQETLVVKPGQGVVWPRYGLCITAMAVYSEALDSWRDLYYPADATMGIPGDQCQNWVFWITLRSDGSAQILRTRGQIGGVGPGYESPPA